MVYRASTRNLLLHQVNKPNIRLDSNSFLHYYSITIPSSLNNALRIILLTVFILFSPYVSSLDSVKVIGPQKASDASHDYFVSLLKMALEKSNHTSTVTIVPHLGQGRVLKMLAASDLYDVVWTGTSKERDMLLHRVPIPLFKGGLGWRGLVMRKNAKDKFKMISDTVELSQYIACQGRHWPDADILKQSGLTVQLVSHFDAMLKMLELNRCDYLPLSIFEGHAELDAVKNKFPSLIFNEELIISYPITMNFYVKKSNLELAKAIEEGLIKLIDSGEFEQHMREHSLTKNGFPLERFIDSIKIELKNDDISQETLNELANYGFKWPLQKPSQENIH
jgi:hypothetical protein